MPRKEHTTVALWQHSSFTSGFVHCPWTIQVRCAIYGGVKIIMSCTRTHSHTHWHVDGSVFRLCISDLHSPKWTGLQQGLFTDPRFKVPGTWEDRIVRRITVLGIGWCLFPAARHLPPSSGLLRPPTHAHQMPSRALTIPTVLSCRLALTPTPR